MSKIGIYVAAIVALYLSPVTFADESLAFCQRITLTSAPHLPVTCEAAPMEWQDGFGPGDGKGDAAPVIIRVGKRPTARVLVLSPKWSSAYDVSTKTIIEELTSKRLGTEFVLVNYQGVQDDAQSALEVAEASGIDLVISMGSATTAFISDHYAGGRIPVVTSCSKDPVSMNLVDPDIGMSQNNIAYTSLNISVSTQVAYLKEKFLKDLTKIAVIYDRDNPSSILTQVRPLEKYLMTSDVGIDLELIEVDFQQVEQTLYEPMRQFSAASSNSTERVFLVTGSTELFNVIERVNAFAGNIPVLSVTPSHVMASQRSVFMAIGVSFKTNARLAADYAYRIITRQSNPETLPVGVVSTPDIAINFQRKPPGELKVPFTFFEDAFFIFNHDGVAVREDGKSVKH